MLKEELRKLEAKEIKFLSLMLDAAGVNGATRHALLRND